MMKLKSLKDLPQEHSYALAIGNFDGVHLGHQFVLNKLVDITKQRILKSILLTFNPHPREILNPADFRLLSSYEEKEKVIGTLGMDYYIELGFNRDFSTLSPSEFLNQHIFVEKNLSFILLGHDFSFGSNKSGGKEELEKFIREKNLEVEVQSSKSFKLDDIAISSSQIRTLISDGEIKKVNGLLGRNFTLSGVIVRGDGRGRKIGFPTANIELPSNQLIPKNGVYISRVTCSDRTYQSITNVGTKPTFKDSQESVVESHILDFDENIYGEVLEVSFIDRIRDEKKFKSVNSLVDQITQDVSKVKDYFKNL